MKKTHLQIAAIIVALATSTSTSFAETTAYTDSNSFFDSLPWNEFIQTWEYTPAGAQIPPAQNFNQITYDYSLDNETIHVTDSFDQATPQGRKSLSLTGPDNAFLSGDTVTLTLDEPSPFFGLFVIVSPDDARQGDFILHFAGQSVASTAQPESILPDGGELYFLGIIDSDSLTGYTTATLESIDQTQEGLFLFNIDDIIAPGCIADIDTNRGVTLSDYARLAAFWLDTNCGLCGMADLTGDNNVLENDLFLLTNDWLCGTE